MSTSPAFSNILQLSHNDCLINSSATYPAIIKATSALLSCRKCSAISCVLVSKIYWITVTHSWFSDARSSSEKLIFSLITFNLLLITFIWFLPTCTHLHVLGETSFISISLQSSSYHVAPWCSGYHYCTTSFNKAWTQVLRRFKPCSRRVGDSRWWGSLTMVPAGNKANRLSSVNHTTETIHHLHLHHLHIL